MKILLVIASILLVFSLSAQDIEHKRAQLEEIKRQIEKTEASLKRNKSKIAKNSQSIQEQKLNIKTSKQRLAKLKEIYRGINAEINDTESEIKTTGNLKDNISSQAGDCFRMLFMAAEREKWLSDETAERQYLNIIVKNSLAYIAELRQSEELLAAIYADKNSRSKKLTTQLNSEKHKQKLLNKKVKILRADSQELATKAAEDTARMGRLKKEALAVDELIAKLIMRASNLEPSYQFTHVKLLWPVQGEIIRGYGYYQQGSTSFKNSGIDIKVAPGTSVFATAGGEVVFAQWYSGAGKLVIINHLNGYYSLYSHNESLQVSIGDEVTRGQVLALSGSSGNTSIPILHFELRKAGKSVDPLNYLP